MKSLLSVGLFVLMCGCIQIAPQLSETIHNGTMYENEIVVGSKNIPLPEGKWKIIASGLESDFFKIYLLKDLDGKEFDLTLIAVDSLQLERKWGYSSYKHFDRTNMLYKKVYNNVGGKKQDAWSINHNTISFDPKPDKPVLSAAATYLKDNHYNIPNVMVAVMHRVTGGTLNKSHYLRVKYYYNPFAVGIAPSPNTDWEDSDWHIMHINKDPQKEAFVETLKVEGPKIHKKILIGLGEHY